MPDRPIRCRSAPVGAGRLPEDQCHLGAEASPEARRIETDEGTEQPTHEPSPRSAPAGAKECRRARLSTASRRLASSRAALRPASVIR